MPVKYSYSWYLNSFEQAKGAAEEFILSAEEPRFHQAPSKGRWSAAECFRHLIAFGNIYYDNTVQSLPEQTVRSSVISRGFPPRWLWKKVAHFLEPPYSFKLKTFSSMKPDPSAGNSRMELLDEYIDLQNRYINQLQQARNHHVDLGRTKIPHPMIRLLKLKLNEQYLLITAHQRRHQWQAEQTASALQEAHS
ncbi:MAG TPA: DinB family protein [Fodinibius sp.]|nr:DinB family protein [Fodinibius sp.]